MRYRAKRLCFCSILVLFCSVVLTSCTISHEGVKFIPAGEQHHVTEVNYVTENYSVSLEVWPHFETSVDRVFGIGGDKRKHVDGDSIFVEVSIVANSGAVYLDLSKSKLFINEEKEIFPVRITDIDAFVRYGSAPVSLENKDAFLTKGVTVLERQSARNFQITFKVLDAKQAIRRLSFQLKGLIRGGAEEHIPIMHFDVQQYKRTQNS